MSWKYRANATLGGLTGYTLTRVTRTPRPAPSPPSPPPETVRLPGDVVRPPVDPAHDRLLREPVFLLSSVRSGSTLLRVLLNSHSRIHSPIETHFRRLTVGLPTDPVRQAMELLGHTHSDIEHIVWDRMLHRELARSGKPILVEKTPSNVFAWRRISACWPDARFIFLLRHPVSIMQSWHEGDPENRPLEEAVPRTLSYMTYLQEARTHLDGVTVRYEALVADPETELRRLCAFLGVEWEPEMLEYGNKDHGGFVKGIGDWREKIRSGTVVRGRPLPSPDEVPEEFREICAQWRYL
ncbi:sulfotransferase family protein [Planobispora rosea]|uniref:Sulfotransferase family protein n=1 Tax=Planobispora rosea TaxID=35762 RepID=A0A8J3S3V4_PLARO|nr:sulfotransferase [Planobispora rosea]GGS71420.1 sulfotransferase family protein [Planobispora rosea]GIH85476.1 sulfotransferase family protein [Planobispora rosea]